MEQPELSVVMGVYNAAQDLSFSIPSVLTQEGVDLELIAVNDGSSDGSGGLLHDFATQDARVRVIDKPVNEGLTKALIDGCNAARGAFIARQDADDRSLPGRFAAQLDLLKTHPDAVMVSCGTRFTAPQGETLFEVSRNGHALQWYLEEEDAERIEGPSHHGSVMFRRSAYLAAGGYREAFLVAQDLDLWVRLSEIGDCLGLPDILYEAAWRQGSISARLRPLQLRAREIVIESRRLRRAGLNDRDPLRGFRDAVELARREARAGRADTARGRAQFDYFVGSNLAQRGNVAAGAYFRSSIRAWPWSWRPWIKLAMISLGLGFRRSE